MRYVALKGRLRKTELFKKFAKENIMKNLLLDVRKNRKLQESASSAKEKTMQDVVARPAFFVGVKMFKPSFMLNSVVDISASFLKENGINALLLDVDNTIITYKGNEIIEGFFEWKQKLQNEGIKILILSNGKSERLKQTAYKAGLEFIPMACKPLPFKYLTALKQLGETRKTTAIVGDQVFTDILGGNLVGMKSVLLKPIKLETQRSFRIRRYLENKLFKIWERKA